MVLMPKRLKYRKQQKGQMRGLTKGASYVAFGDYGIQALDRAWIRAEQIEACRVAVNRHFSRKGKVWFRLFPDKPVTKKPAETRMGTGKGALDHYVAVVKPGRILMEVGNVTKDQAQTALRLAAAKLPIRTRFVQRLERV